MSEGIKGEIGQIKPKKQPRQKLTLQEKAIRVILRRSGRKELPKLEEIMRRKQGQELTIRDIGIFAGKPKDKLIAELAKECMVGNILNFSADITKLRVLQIATQILKAGCMYSPIHVAYVKDNNSFQCISGRHRLVFLILAYGCDSKVKCYVEEMSLEEAREAMSVANDCRPAKAKERAELTILRETRGRTNINQEELYKQIVKNKIKAVKYGIYSITERNYPLGLSFKVSPTPSLNDGGIMTLSSVEQFLNNLEWNEQMTPRDFDRQLLHAIEFINNLVKKFQESEHFHPESHLNTKSMFAIGQFYFENKKLAGKNIDMVVRKIIEMGDTGKIEIQEIYNKLKLV